MTRGTIRLATRGSQLALWQAANVKDRLNEHRYDVELVEVSTRGDEITDQLVSELGQKGAFVHSLDEEILEGNVDAAVHSLKDLPTEDRQNIVIAAVPERAPSNDVLVTPDGKSLNELKTGATVGTSSTRRRAQILSDRPDLDVEPLRGNVDTRLEKMLAPHLQREHERRLEADADEFEMSVEEWFDARSEIEKAAMERSVETSYDAIVLAQSGLDRINIAESRWLWPLPEDSFVPAPGQGAIVVTAEDGEMATTLRDALDRPRIRVETAAERTILASLGGGCIAPVGVRANLQGEYIHVNARILSADGTKEINETRDLPVKKYLDAARDLADDLENRGARKLIEEAK
ncbi:MAG: hydroxymethylbilane synthase [Halobacteriaceae archaeon]